MTASSPAQGDTQDGAAGSADEAGYVQIDPRGAEWKQLLRHNLDEAPTPVQLVARLSARADAADSRAVLDLAVAMLGSPYWRSADLTTLTTICKRIWVVRPGRSTRTPEAWPSSLSYAS